MQDRILALQALTPFTDTLGLQNSNLSVVACGDSQTSNTCGGNSCTSAGC